MSQIIQIGASASGTQKGETFPRINWSSDSPWRSAGIWILLGPLGLAGVLPGGPATILKLKINSGGQSSQKFWSALETIFKW